MSNQNESKTLEAKRLEILEAIREWDDDDTQGDGEAFALVCHIREILDPAFDSVTKDDPQ